MTLYRLTLGTYDPVNPGGNEPTVDVQCAGFGVVLPAGKTELQAFGQADNRLLTDPLAIQKFRYVILAGKGLTFIPTANDILKTNEGLYRLIGATPLDPAGQGAILFSCGCSLDIQLSIP